MSFQNVKNVSTVYKSQQHRNHIGVENYLKYWNFPEFQENIVKYRKLDFVKISCISLCQA